MSQIVLPYCYKITHKTTGQFYIGSRCNKKAKHHSEDFGIRYFTSSKTVKELGFSNFRIDWIEEFPSAELAYDWEQMMIHVNLRDPLCLNKFSTFKNNKRWSTAGKKYIFSKEHKEKISKSKIGRKYSKHAIDKRIETITKNQTFVGYNNPMYGKKHSKESKIKMSEIKKGFVPWNKGLKNCYSEETKLKFKNRKGNKSKLRVHYFIKNGLLLKINNLKEYCSTNKLNYGTMLNISLCRRNIEYKDHYSIIFI